MVVIYLLGVILAYIVIRDFLSFHKKEITKENFGWVLLLSLLSWVVILVFIMMFIWIKYDNCREDKET